MALQISAIATGGWTNYQKKKKRPSKTTSQLNKSTGSTNPTKFITQKTLTNL